MISIKTKQLQLVTLEQRLADARDLGGLIYIKKVDANNRPMNFRVHGTSAESGKWGKGLTSRKLTWMLIYQRFKKSHGKILGQVWMGYYDKISEEGGAYIFHLSNVAGPLGVEKSLHELVGKRAPQNPVYLSLRMAKATSKYENELIDDLGALTNGSTQTTTEIAQRILARLGQGKFRINVLHYWDGACAVTGCTTSEAIRASHIKPWHNSNDKERLNPQNGLPLVATLDSLFDCGLISFSDKGEMLVSPGLDDDAKQLFSVPAKLRKVLNDEQSKFLKYHRKHIFRKTKKKSVSLKTK